VGKAIAIDEQVRAYGGPQLQLMQDVMTKLATAIETSKVPIVPSTVVNMGGGSDGDGGAAGSNAFGLLMAMLATEKLSGMTTTSAPADPAQQEMVASIKAGLRDTMTRPKVEIVAETVKAASAPEKPVKPVTE